MRIPERMSDNKIFIGNIPHFINDQLLRKRFEEHGKVLDLFYFADTLGSDRGWATMVYPGRDEAATAVAIENGEEDPWPGAERPLHVKFFNQSLTVREGTVFDLRPRNQKVLTPWKEVVSEDPEDAGTTYYVNELTEETTWERPVVLDQVVDNPSGANVQVGHAEMVDIEQGLVSSAVGGTDQGPLGCNLFVHGNFQAVSDQMFYDAFVPFGYLLGCKVVQAKSPDGYGHVSFSTIQETVECIRGLHLTDVFQNGGTIKVGVKKSEEQYNPEARQIAEDALLNHKLPITAG